MKFRSALKTLLLGALALGAVGQHPCDTHTSGDWCYAEGYVSCPGVGVRACQAGLVCQQQTSLTGQGVVYCVRPTEVDSSSEDCDDDTATPAPTSAPAATPAPTPKPTSAPAATPAPTSRPVATPAPTSAPTPKRTPRPTTAPKATPAPTTKPVATVAPSTAPTTKPPTSPTTKPPTSPSGRRCPAGQVWAPAPGTTWQWQLTSKVDTTKLQNVQMYDIDLFDNSADTIAAIHAQGKAVICYFSTQYEDKRDDSNLFTAAVKGHALDGWPGEYWVDIRSPLVRTIMQGRLDLAVAKGCDGVEPDNVDGYANTNGLGLTAADQLDFNKFIANEAHKRGLSVGLKNDLDQVNQLQPYFDWALNEQCNQYDECQSLTKFTAAGKAVFGVEYDLSVGSFCPAMVSNNFSWLKKKLDLGSEYTACCTDYTSDKKCPAPAYTCTTPSSKRSLEEDALVEEVVATAEVVEAAPEFDSAATSVALPIVAVALVSAIALVL